ncbi:hypothetical protein TrVE_jg7980 [Triparma verrucosa]|uniref:Uncharacterized protein n=1 Tax=Triparma verrucosa TaxID=1606542 RepID=A0A9W7BNK2_9STRA|nr:hypothetical protein TrVE_jg7980 [Triparma verrucosa]
MHNLPASLWSKLTLFSVVSSALSFSYYFYDKYDDSTDSVSDDDESLGYNVPWYAFGFAAALSMVGDAVGECEFLPVLSLASLDGFDGTAVESDNKVIDDSSQTEEDGFLVDPLLTSSELSSTPTPPSTPSPPSPETDVDDNFVMSYSVSIDLGNSVSDLITPMFIKMLGHVVGEDEGAWMAAGLVVLGLWKVGVCAVGRIWWRRKGRVD